MSKSADAFDLHTQLNESEIDCLISLVAKNAWWVHSEVCKAKGEAVYPMTRRAKSGEARGNVDADGVQVKDNSQAQQAFFPALGKRPEDFENFKLCHIYDSKAGGLEKGHFTNLANMVLLPQALASLSEFEPVNQALKRHSYDLYDHYTGPDGAIPPEPLKHYPWREADSLSKDEIENIVARLKRRQERDLKRAADFIRRSTGVPDS